MTRKLPRATEVHITGASDDALVPVSTSFGPVGSHSDGASISSATTLTPPAGATKLLIQALDQNVRYTLDGTTPTATTGFRLVAGDPPIIIPIGANTTVKVIQEAATADLNYQWGN